MNGFNDAHQNFNLARLDVLSERSVSRNGNLDRSLFDDRQDRKVEVVEGACFELETDIYCTHLVCFSSVSNKHG